MCIRVVSSVLYRPQPGGAAVVPPAAPPVAAMEVVREEEPGKSVLAFEVKPAEVGEQEQLHHEDEDEEDR